MDNGEGTHWGPRSERVQGKDKKYVTGLPRLRNSSKVHGIPLCLHPHAQAVEILSSGLGLAVGSLLPVPVPIGRKHGATKRPDLVLPATVRRCVFLVF